MSEDMIQGTDEWHQARLGKVTASRVADVIAKTKTGWGASRANYAAQLIAERLTGISAESYSNAAMAHGIATEPEALSCYVFMRDATVTPVGFVPHPRIPQAGASPDGLVSPDGLAEIKCPQTATHLDTLLGQSIPGKYATQMQFQMACTGRQWCDFVSYDPRLPQTMRLFVRRLKRDEALIAELEKEVTAFLAEIEDKLEKLSALYAPPSLKERLIASAAIASAIPADLMMGG